MSRQKSAALASGTPEAAARRKALTTGFSASYDTLVFPHCQQWVVWRNEKRSGKDAKVPYTPGTGRQASTTEPRTWRTHAEAVAAAKRGCYDGIGFVFTKSDGLTGVDLDHCRDPESGDVEAWAREIVSELDSYTEVSPSGEGLHVFVEAKLPAGGRKRGDVEMYDSARYFTVTGRHLEGTPEAIEARQSEVDALHKRFFGSDAQKRPERPLASSVSIDDAELLKKAQSAANGPKFARLWAGDASDYPRDDGTPDSSCADLALCALLAFWTAGDADRIDRLFRQSGLYRPKWERRDYRERTIAKAIAGTTEFYTPPDDDGRNETAAKLTYFARTREWENKRTASTRRAAYLAYIDAYKESGETTIKLSARQLAERAGIGKDTANTARRDLIAAGLLRGDTSDTDLYHTPEVELVLDVEDFQSRTVKPIHSGGVSHNTESPHKHVFLEDCPKLETALYDASAWGARLRDYDSSERPESLGKAAEHMIWALSQQNGLFYSELRELLKLAKSTISKKARAMAGAYGLVKLERTAEGVRVWLVENWQSVLVSLRERLTTYNRKLLRQIDHAEQRLGHYRRLLRCLPRKLRAHKDDIIESGVKLRQRLAELREQKRLEKPPAGYHRWPRRVRDAALSAGDKHRLERQRPLHEAVATSFEAVVDRAEGDPFVIPRLLRPIAAGAIQIC